MVSSRIALNLVLMDKILSLPGMVDDLHPNNLWFPIDYCTSANVSTVHLTSVYDSYYLFDQIIDDCAQNLTGTILKKGCFFQNIRIWK